MKAICYREDETRYLEWTDLGTTVIVRPGWIRANCSWKQSSEYQRLGAVDCTLEICASNSQSLRSVTTWSSVFFWIKPGDTAHAVRDGFVPDFSFSAMLDIREDFDIAIDTGQRIQGFLKYTPVAFEIMLSAEKLLLVRTTIKSGEAGNTSFFHEIPAVRLFWAENGVTHYALAVERHIGQGTGKSGMESPIEVLR